MSKVWGGLGLFSLVTIVLGIWLATASRHQINREGFQRIEVGMTEDEVEAIMGKPPGDYSTRAAYSTYMRPATQLALPEPKEWLSDEAHIVVRFAGGRVESAESYELIYTYPRLTMLDRLRLWSGL